MTRKNIENLTIGRHAMPEESSMVPWNHPRLQKGSVMDPKTLEMKPPRPRQIHPWKPLHGRKWIRIGRQMPTQSSKIQLKSKLIHKLRETSSTFPAPEPQHK